MDPDYFSYHSDGSEDTFQNLSKSDYAKVIFCDLYYNIDNTVGCRFQITDHVHEDPCDYIGLFRVGYDNLSQCLAAKMLSDTECEEDGKLLRCTFQPSELPELENGFYQFLYVTRDNEVCGASMPFQTKNSMKELSSDEDVVAENAEDDFLVVRSNMAERNRRLQTRLDEMTEKCFYHENEMKKIQHDLKLENEKRNTLEHLLKKASDEKLSLLNESQRIAEEKNIVCIEKEEAIRILKEKNKVFSSMFDNYSDKLKEFTELKDALEADKDLAITQHKKLQESYDKVVKELQEVKRVLDIEKGKNRDLGVKMLRENSGMASQLEDAKLMIEALEKSKQLSMDDISSLNVKVTELQEKLKEMKCEKLVLKTCLNETSQGYDKLRKEKEAMASEVAALKLHIVEIHESQSRRRSSISSQESKQESSSSSSKSSRKGSKSSKFQEESIQTDQTNEELQNLKIHCDELHTELEEKNAAILKLKEELVKANGVVEYLTKEKDSIQKNESMKQQALDECVLRLNEASELYKKQFRKIEKLKKKLIKNGTDSMDKISSASMSTKGCPSIADSADEAVSEAVQPPQNQNSDSDTGEHVVRDPIQKTRALYPTKQLVPESISLLSSAEAQPSSSKIRQVPELQTLIEMNLEKFQNSKSKDEDEILYSIPCPVCDQDVGVYISSTDEMVKHLEVQHKQQVCPVCGKLFDMNLPLNYFAFHVEDHFMKGNKK